jgi:hypothetical protein
MHLGETELVAADERDGCAFESKAAGYGGTDATGGAGDEGMFASKGCQNSGRRHLRDVGLRRL